MSVVKSPLSEEHQQIAGEALQGALSDLLDLSLIAKQAHWNLYGPRFRSIHLQLDEVVTAARDYADTVAERAAAVGVSPDGRVATVAESSGLPTFPEGWIQDGRVVSVLVEVYEVLINRMRARIEATEKADAVTQDLFISLTAELEKENWMFQAENQD
ncbi:DNA starvation/stationary phase protection protein [[Kitasatospora] papulosa]|uniref:Dps family protein n=1 Tax=[Kitasatospora] papulosa TaxID=1464011 RepID=UPI00367A303E